MGEEKQISFEQEKQSQSVVANKKSDECCESMESSSFSSSLSSSEMEDDASSFNKNNSISSSSSSSHGPLFELAELVAQLPIKRGLSKFYHGKSQTFGSLANVKSLEDLAKKDNCYKRRMKSWKCYGENLNRHKLGPKSTITKRVPKRSSFSPGSNFLSSKGAMVCQL